MKSKTAVQKILEFYDSLKSAGINLPEKISSNQSAYWR